MSTTITFNSAGFAEILQSEGVQACVAGVTQEVADRANANYGGDGFYAETFQATKYKDSRWLGTVSSTDKESLIAESEEQALTRAIT